MAIKDVLSTRNIRTTCASKILETYVPPYDATAVERLDRAGAVFLGKTNCDEFAMGGSNENSAYGPVRNPVAPDHVPGGSSGGSAAAVAAGLAVAALGTDTGGSIRQPGAYCGIPALMPTYGRVSRYGLIAFASSLDKIGPFASNVADAAAVMQVIAGHDPNDSTSADVPVPNYSSETRQASRLAMHRRTGGLFRRGHRSRGESESRGGRRAFRTSAAGECRSRCLTPTTQPRCITCIATAEASSNFARYDGVRYGLRVPGATLTEMYRNTRENGFGAEVKRRIMLGTYVSPPAITTHIICGRRSVRMVAQDFADAFKKVDAIITPTAPTPAFGLGEKTSDPLQMYLADIYTVTGSLAGVPGISIPCGKNRAGLPIGMQIFGPHFAESRVLQVARAFEEAGGFGA